MDEHTADAMTPAGKEKSIFSWRTKGLFALILTSWKWSLPSLKKDHSTGDQGEWGKQHLLVSWEITLPCRTSHGSSQLSVDMLSQSARRRDICGRRPGTATVAAVEAEAASEVSPRIVEEDSSEGGEEGVRGTGTPEARGLCTPRARELGGDIPVMWGKAHWRRNGVGDCGGLNCVVVGVIIDADRCGGGGGGDEAPKIGDTGLSPTSPAIGPPVWSAELSVLEARLSDRFSCVGKIGVLVINIEARLHLLKHYQR